MYECFGYALLAFRQCSLFSIGPVFYVLILWHLRIIQHKYDTWARSRVSCMNATVNTNKFMYKISDSHLQGAIFQPRQGLAVQKPIPHRRRPRVQTQLARPWPQMRRRAPQAHRSRRDLRGAAARRRLLPHPAATLYSLQPNQDKSTRAGVERPRTTRKTDFFFVALY